jgi:hypothetical protein
MSKVEFIIAGKTSASPKKSKRTNPMINAERKKKTQM